MSKTENKIKKIIFYTIFFLPGLLIGSELILSGVDVIIGDSLQTKIHYHQTILDPISGWRTVKKEGYINDERNYLNKHGLVKTFFTSNKSENPNTKGILITGNSVAWGTPLNQIGQNNKTFVYLLEKNLIYENFDVDIINLSQSGFNSWQEHVQVARYLNSAPLHNDLPAIDLIASIGGVQDFWGFVNVLDSKNNPKNEYYKANGLMTWDNNILSNNIALYIFTFNEALNGNIKLGFNLFLNSIVTNTKTNSKTYKYLSYLKNSILPKRGEKISSVKELSSKTLKETIDRKIKINMNDYINKRNYVIDSVVRNIEYISSLKKNKKIIYVYLPTKFSSKKTKKVSEKLDFLPFDLDMMDLHELEKDYRKNLLSRISVINNVEIIDIASIGSDSWFTDLSHYSVIGNLKISQILKPIFTNYLK